MSKLTLESLVVESFTTQGVGDLSYSAVAAAPAISQNYSACITCGIACTVVGCVPLTGRYTDCGSCGIACTAVDPC